MKPTPTHPRKKPTFETYLFLGSILLFVLALITLLVASFVAAERTHTPYQGVQVGSAITSGSSTLTVTGVAHKPGSPPFVAPKGYEYVIVTLSVRNNTDKPFDVLPTNDTYVKTTDGTVSYLTPFALEQPYHSGKVLPGETTKGELSYLVPKDSSYKFYVESGWSGTAVPFMLQSGNTQTK